MTSNLGLTQLSASQNNKEVTINDANGEIDAAITATLTVDVDDSNAATIAIADLRRANIVQIDEDTTPPDAAITITFTAFARGAFVLRNNTAQTVTATITGQTETAPEIPAGESHTLTMDGSDVISAGGGGGGGGGGTDIVIEADGTTQTATLTILDFDDNFTVTHNGSGDYTIGLTGGGGGGGGGTPGDGSVTPSINALKYAPPAIADFGTTLNSPSTVATGDTALVLSGSANADLLRGYQRAVPGGDFTITARIINDFQQNFNGAGILIKDTNDEYISWGPYHNSGPAYEAGHWTDQTTFDTGYFGDTGLDRDIEWFRVAVVSGTANFYYSYDGEVWILAGTDAQLTTLDTYGFGVACRHISTPPIAAFLYWEDGGNADGEVQTIGVASAPSKVTINDQTGTSYTLVLSDGGKYVRMTNASANTLTVPANATVAYEIGTVITVRQGGAGQTTIVEDTGVTINTPETLLLRAQHSTASLIKVDTDEWDLTGDLEAA